MNLINYTPAWMLRVVADGALGVLYLFPTTLGVVVYAWICFLCVDATLSGLTRIVGRRVLAHALSSDMVVGHPATRLRYWLPYLFTWLLKVWVGLPAFHVINLIMSKDGVDTVALKSLVSGYAWQSIALQSLEGHMISAFSAQSNITQASQLLVVVAFLIYIHMYAYKGFDVVRRVRKVGDIVLSSIGAPYRQSPSLRQCCLRLQANGWSRSEAIAAGWFLALVNVRIVKRIRQYETVTPLQYAGFKVTTSVGAAVGLTLVHPLVAGLYFSWLIKGFREMGSLRRRYTCHFCELPEWIQAFMRSTYELN